MLEQLSRHSLIDITLRAEGDLHIDYHHTTEDTGIVLGECLSKALGDRPASAAMARAHIPMDETLTEVALDASNRPYLIWKVDFSKPKLGTMDTELFKEWFQAFAQLGGLTLHVWNHYGDNNHHIVESCFKGLARALRDRRSRSIRARRRRSPAPRASSTQPDDRRHRRLRIGQPPLRREGLRARRARGGRGRPRAGDVEPARRGRRRPHRAAGRRRLRRLPRRPLWRAGHGRCPAARGDRARQALPRHLRRHAAHGHARRRVRHPCRARLDRRATSCASSPADQGGISRSRTWAGTS